MSTWAHSVQLQQIFLVLLALSSATTSLFPSLCAAGQKYLHSFCSFNVVKLNRSINISVISLKRLRGKFIYSTFKIKISCTFKKSTSSPLWLQTPAGTAHVHVQMHFLLAGKARSTSSLTPQSFHAWWSFDALKPIDRLLSVWMHQAVSDGSGKQEKENSHEHEADCKSLKYCR